VHKRWHNDGLGGGIIAIIVISAFVAVVLCSAAALVFLFKHRKLVCDPVPTPRALPPSHNKPSGTPYFNTIKKQVQSVAKFSQLVA
jgi:hypothetical protein